VRRDINDNVNMTKTVSRRLDLAQNGAVVSEKVKIID
jgi:hypothetical protein